MSFDPDRLRTRMAQDLSAIVLLYEHLPTESVNRADQASEDVLPGGDALNMLGPAANTQAWQYQYEHQEELGTTTGRADYAADQVDHEDHPLLVLATWEDVVRDERGQPADLRATVKRAADYLRSSLDWMLATDTDGVPQFLPLDALVRDLRKVRGRLEGVLHDGIRHDRGVPCMYCGQPLTKVWALEAEDDRWHCRPCDLWSTPEQYDLAVQADFRATSDRLNSTDMTTQYRIPPGSLTGWASKGVVRKRGRDASGRQLYDVNDALTQRDKHDAA